MHDGRLLFGRLVGDGAIEKVLATKDSVAVTRSSSVELERVRSGCGSAITGDFVADVVVELSDVEVEVVVAAISLVTKDEVNTDP